ncbi:ATP-binding protein [Pirellulaceae bacterium SH467]
MEPNVLLVEDDHYLRTLVQVALHKSGFQVSVCETAAEAMDLVESDRFAIAIIDVGLSDDNGLDVAQVIATRSPDIKILIFTSDTRYESVVRALAIQAFSYIEKAKGIHELTAQVNRAWSACLRSALSLKQRDCLLQLNLLDALDDFALALDHRQRIIFANSPLLRLFDATWDVVVGTPMTQWMLIDPIVEHSSRNLLVTIFNHLSTQMNWNGTVRLSLLRPSSEVDEARLIDLKFISLRGADTERIGYAAIFKDIERSFQNQSRIALRREELFRAQNNSIATLVADSLSHEINQPLATIANYLGGIRIGLQRQNLTKEELDHTLDIVEKQTQRASGVLARLRQFLRREIAPFSKVEIASWIYDTLALFEKEFERVGVVTKTRIPLDAGYLMGDYVQLQQVLANIISNSIDAMDCTRPKRPIFLVSVRTNDQWVQLQTIDNGAGVSEEILEKMFDPYVTTKPTGTGLGLSISTEIIRAHHGSMHASRRRKRGLGMKITLPRCLNTLQNDPHSL